MPTFKIDKKNYLNVTEQPMSGSSFINWFKVLMKNHFNIDYQFIPRALYVTAMTAALSLFRTYEHRKFHQLVKKVKVKEPVFIIGHFRSGTTFLHYLLGQDPNLGYVSTFETMTPGMIIANEEMFKNLVKNHLPAKRPMDDLEMHANLPYEEEYAIANMSPFSFYHGWYFPKRWNHYFDKYVLFKNSSQQEIDTWKQTYDYFLKKITYKNNGNHIILKNLVNTARIKHLLDLYPNARFIHIHRNPYHVYRSTWKLYQKILPIFSFQHIDSETLDTYILESYKKLFTAYLKEKHLIPKENLIEYSYNTFIKHPIDTIKKTYDSLRLSGFDNARPLFQDYADKHRNYKASTYTFTEKEKQKIYHHWKFMFDAYNYPQ
jgi:omega-hydroxy-beta-dihydromenaquinone-9 sulfotransferase